MRHDLRHCDHCVSLSAAKISATSTTASKPGQAFAFGASLEDYPPLLPLRGKIDGYSSLTNAAIPDLRANLSQTNWSSALNKMPAGMPMYGANPVTVVTASLITLPAVVCTPNPSFALKLAIRSRISASLNLSTSDH